MPRCDEHGHYESRCPDCAQAFGHADCEDTIAGLRADVERLTRELREARAAIRAAERCRYMEGDFAPCLRTATCATHGIGVPMCEVHRCACGVVCDDSPHRDAILAAEGSE